jgi:hypothetical protein
MNNPGYPAHLTYPVPGWVRLKPPRAGMQLPPEEEQWYSLTLARIAENTKPEEPILCLPNCPGIYFLADRRAITRYHLIYPGMLTRQEEIHITRQMERRKVRLVVFNAPPESVAAYAPALTNYLRKTCEAVAYCGMFEVWERKATHAWRRDSSKLIKGDGEAVEAPLQKPAGCARMVSLRGRTQDN